MSNCQKVKQLDSTVDPGFGNGGLQKIFTEFFQLSEVSQHQPGSRACLRALEVLAFLNVKYAFCHFLVLFSKCLMYICVGALQNI